MAEEEIPLPSLFPDLSTSLSKPTEFGVLLLEDEDLCRTETPEPLIHAGSYTPPPPEASGPLDTTGWCNFFRRQIAGTSVLTMTDVSDVGPDEPPLELFVTEEDLCDHHHHHHHHHKGIPVGPALAGWIETLQLPPKIKEEACLVFRHKNNQVVTTAGSIGDARQDTIRQFVILLQQMYKLKMAGETLDGLQTLMPIFLSLAEKL